MPVKARSALASPPEALGALLVAGVPRRLAPPEPLRLHVGSGPERLEGWLNLDLERLPGVDLVLDVREGLAFEDVEAVFAEHFLEHLTAAEALDFFAEVHACLRPEGRLRLSTPNLDWVLGSHTRSGNEQHDLRSVLALNRAFYSWGHRFLWSRELLSRALRATGFADLSWPAYGQSEWPAFRGLERHQAYGDREDLRHVLVVEARKARLDQSELAGFRALLREELLRYQERALGGGEESG
jgi:SAM-dependent methyltransferase